MVAEQLGALVGWFLVPLLILLVIGLIEYLRTGERDQAQRVAFSWWAIALAIGFFLLSLVARFVQRFA